MSDCKHSVYNLLSSSQDFTTTLYRIKMEPSHHQFFKINSLENVFRGLQVLNNITRIQSIAVDDTTAYICHLKLRVVRL